MTELQTDCELLWTQLTIGNSNKLFVGAYYKPHNVNRFFSFVV